MKRTAAVLAITLVLGACGGDDDVTRTDTPNGTDGSEAAGPGEEPASDEPASDEPSEEPSDEAGGGSIASLDDVPEQCRDLMEDYLRDLEPIVSQVDWQGATLSDFEQISAEFEERSSAFDADTESEGCDDLEFADGDGFGLIIELADDVAPGTVPFFEFLDTMRTGVIPSDDDAEAGGFDDCDDAIEAIEALMEEYDSFTDAPISELAKFANMASAMTSCTPEQMSFFDRPEVSDFLSP